MFIFVYRVSLYLEDLVFLHTLTINPQPAWIILIQREELLALIMTCVGNVIHKHSNKNIFEGLYIVGLCGRSRTRFNRDKT